LSGARDDEQQLERLGELRSELQLHIARLRARLSTFPIAEERRVHIDIPIPGIVPEKGEPITTLPTEIVKEPTTVPTKPNGNDRKRAG
jgi:hypothetical protein